MKEFLEEYGGCVVLILFFLAILFAYAEVMECCRAGTFLGW